MMTRMASDTRNRTTIMLAVAVAVLIIGVVGATAFALTRPDASATPAPSASGSPSNPTPSPTPTSTPTPTPSPTESPAQSQLVMAAEGFTLTAADGSELLAYRWADDGATAVDALTEGFGADPAVTVEENDGTHYPDYTAYTWDGFVFYDSIAVDGGKPRDEYSQPSYAQITGARVGDVAIIPEFGLEIGLTAVDACTLDIGAENGLTPEDARGQTYDECSDEAVAGAQDFTFAPERSEFVDGAVMYSVAAIVDPATELVTAIVYYFYSDL